MLPDFVDWGCVCTTGLRVCIFIDQQCEDVQFLANSKEPTKFSNVDDVFERMEDSFNMK